MKFVDDYDRFGSHVAPGFTCTCTACGSKNTEIRIEVAHYDGCDWTKTVEVVCLDCSQSDTPIHNSNMW